MRGRTTWLCRSFSSPKAAPNRKSGWHSTLAPSGFRQRWCPGHRQAAAKTSGCTLILTRFSPRALQGPGPQGAEPLPKTRHRTRVARMLPPPLSAKPSNPVADYLRVNAELDKLGLGHASARRARDRSQAASLPHSPADKAPSVGVAPPVPGPGKPPSEQATAAPHKPYPSPERLAATVYHETSSLREKPGGPTLAALREAIANAALNRIDHPQKGGVAPDTLTPAEIKAIARNAAAKSAYDGSLKAATEAIARTAPPTTGADSALFYNNRPNGSTDPNRNYKPPAPLLATLGPYHNVAPTSSAPADTTYFAFFGEGNADK